MRDINNVVTKLELDVLFTDCDHNGATTSMEHGTIVREDPLHHVDDMAGGQWGRSYDLTPLSPTPTSVEVVC